MTPRTFFFRGGAVRRQDGEPAPAGHSVPEERRVVPDGPAGGRPRAGAPAPVDRARAETVRAAADRWHRSLVRLGGTSTLADLTLLGDAIIDLTAAHPSGIAQLYAGRTTRLSNLVREGSAQVAARRSARTVRARADELAQRYGVAPTYLAIGVATWTELPDPAAPDPDERRDVRLEVSADPRSAHAAGTGPGPDATVDAPAAAGPAADGAAEEEVAAAPADGTPAEATHDGTAPAAVAPDDADAAPAADASADPLVADLGAVGTPVRTIHAPVLLRAVRLWPTAGPESDFDVDLESAIEINPILVRALRAAGVQVDVAAVARSAYAQHGFSPRGALMRLAQLGRENLPGFELEERIVVGPFMHPGQVLVDDLTAMRDHLPASDVVAALAGDADARAALGRPVPPHVPGDRAPEADRGAGDLDADQAHAVDAVAAGGHVFLDAPPGADVAGTLAAVAADAAASGRTVVYVPGTRRAGRSLLHRLDELGLGELVLDLSADARWRSAAAQRLRTGLDPDGPDRVPAPADDGDVHAARAELTRVRGQLRDYVTGMHAVHEPWGVSAYDALQALARLTSSRPGPRTRVRLDAAALRTISADDAAGARDALVRAAALGAFTLRPHDTPWYGARLTEPEQASRALERTQRLGELTLPALVDQVERVADQTGLHRATSLQSWLEQLRMLDGVAEALDIFQPQIFERSAADMVVATSTRAWRTENGVTMKASVRRRLRKQARDLLRPGRPVADLHAELVRVQEQREIWRRHNPAGGWPRLPDGLAEIEATEAEVRADVEALQDVVGAGAGRDDLLTMPLDELTARMRELGQDAPALRLLPERTALLERLRQQGLGDLADDLARRRVTGSLVGAELDLARWSSVLEQILRTDPALVGLDGPALTGLVEQFRQLDEAQVASLPGPVRRAVTERLRGVVRDRRERAAQLFRSLGSDHGAHLRETLTQYHDIASAARPVWLVTPTLVPQLLGEGGVVDLLVLDGAQHLPVEQAVTVLARARQVVLVGDSRRGGDGIVGALGPLLPTVTLPTDRAERDEGLAAFLTSHGYDGVIRSVPAPPSTSRMRLEPVAGFGMPAPGAGAVESVQAEVDRVVDLVIDHALTAPEQSLAVVALNARHAERVREAVTAAVADGPAVADFFRGDRDEPFVVVDVDAAGGLRRDVVILSVGFGKTPHGRVLHQFGSLSGPDGLACLVDILDAVRHRLVLVSCIGPGDLDRARLRQPGPKLLADLIDLAATGTLPGQEAGSGPVHRPDQLLVDLAERLWRLGLTVVPRYGVEGGVRIPLAVGHPELPGELLVAVLTDDPEYVAEQSLRRRDRHWVQRLTARGWRVRTAFSTTVFLDPQAEAEGILEEVMAVVRERRAARAQTATVPYGLPDAAPDDASDDPLDDARTATPATPATAATSVTSATPADAADGSGDPVRADGPDGPVGPVGPTDDAPEATAAPLREREPRPPVVPGLPLAAYGDDQLDELLAWIESDGAQRADAELVEELRSELALTRRGAQVDAVLGHVVRRRVQ